MVLPKNSSYLKGCILIVAGLIIYLVLSSIYNESPQLLKSSMQIVRTNDQLKTSEQLLTSSVQIVGTNDQLKTSEQSLPSEQELDRKSWSELEDIYHEFLKYTQVKCHKIIRVGNRGDGGWNVCADDKYVPKKPCLVYSFGIGGDSSFDTEMQKIFGCEVHSFDPFVNKAKVPNVNLMNFHSIGLLDKTAVVSKRQFMTLLDIRKHLNHSTKNIDVLKIDIEMAEWPSLTKAMADGEMDHVKQLLIEFHTVFSEQSKFNVFRTGLIIIKKLMALNFRMFSIEKNENCKYISRNIKLTKCYNVHIVKVS